MKHALITTAAAALLLASQGAIAQAQERGERPGQGAGPQGPGPGASPGGMGPGAGGPGRSGEAPGRAGPPAHAQGPERGNSANAPGHNPANAPHAQQPQRPAQQQAQPHAQPHAQPRGEPQRTGESKQQPVQPRADAKGKDADQNRTARDNATPKADSKEPPRGQADRGRDADRDRNNTAQGRNDANDKGHGDRMAGNQDLRQARERLDTQERTRLHQAFDRQGARSNVRVNVRVGARVPRTVHLVRVPQTVISFFPYYRDYSYFAEGDTIYIVNPRSYEVVDVIDEGYGRGQPVQQAHLNLSQQQIAIVQDFVNAADIRPENLRLRLALGAEIPRDVELRRFPDRVVDDIRELENFRFVVVEDQIVIVNPQDRSIALVIDRT